VTIAGLSIAVPSNGVRPGLLDTIESVREDARLLGFDVEILVVWNIPGDPPSWAALLPEDVHQIVERQPGLSRARNAALRSASAPLVAFVDDDARCRPGWLAALDDAWKTGAHVVGGPIDVIWPNGRPRWASGNAASMYGFFHPREPYDAGSRGLVGMNMAMDRAAILAIGGFDETLGHGASRGMMGEDNEICLRAQREGLVVRYEPRAEVEHHVEPTAVTRVHYVRRMYRFGRTMTWLHVPPEGKRSVFRRAVKAIGFVAVAPFSGSPTESIAEAWWLFGSISALREIGSSRDGRRARRRASPDQPTSSR
jgi:glycosyltransferase involved in cell wall biosynthesis